MTVLQPKSMRTERVGDQVSRGRLGKKKKHKRQKKKKKDTQKAHFVQESIKKKNIRTLKQYEGTRTLCITDRQTGQPVSKKTV